MHVFPSMVHPKQKRKKVISMVEQDTIKLLRECDAGAKMAVTSIDDVLDSVKNGTLRKALAECKEKHIQLDSEIHLLLTNYGDEGKEPSFMAESMSWLKTNAKMMMDDSDETIADLMIDGCDMGVKSLSRYLNKYKAADEASKRLAKRLIHSEEQLASDLRPYL